MLLLWSMVASDPITELTMRRDIGGENGGKLTLHGTPIPGTKTNPRAGRCDAGTIIWGLSRGSVYGVSPAARQVSVGPVDKPVARIKRSEIRDLLPRTSGRRIPQFTASVPHNRIAGAMRSTEDDGDQNAKGDRTLHSSCCG
jgi:hypothetical protein